MSPLDGVKRFIASHTEVSSAAPQGLGSAPLPPSLGGDYEMHSFSGGNNAPANTVPAHTPYLGLRARLSQVWINRWTILLALIICRLLLSIKDINYDIAQAKQEALSACTSVENVGSAMASMPHYLSDGVNALAADGVTDAMHGLAEMLMLTVTGVEEIILFVINMMTSTYVCLITLAISGSLEVAIQMIEDVGNAMNKSIGSITGDLSTAVSDFQNALNAFLKPLSIPASLLGSSSEPTQIDLSSQINALNNIHIDPTTMDSDLTKLNASIPTFAQVQNFTNNVIRTPFEFVKQAINDSIANYTFDKSVFPVAQKKALTFCSDNSAIDDFFEGLIKIIYEARKIFLIVLILLAILVCIPMAYREIWHWRTMQQRALLLQKHAFDPIDVVYIASRPYTTTAGIKLAARFKNPKHQILTRWFIAYATSTPALFVLALGMAGLFSCLCQYIILKALEKEVPILAQEVGSFADKVVSALENASTDWAVKANTLINTTNVKVNNDVFGWVNTTTTAVNGTLNTFTDEMSKELNATFGGTILYEPITGVLNCLIGLKIAGIEKALTWVSDHAHVTFPEFRTDVFSLGAAASLTNSSSASSFLSSPGTVASDDVTNAITKVALKLQDAIRQEALISASVVLVWVLVLLIGLIAALAAMWTRNKTRAEGGVAGWSTNNDDNTRLPFSPESPPPFPYENSHNTTTTTSASASASAFPKFSSTFRTNVHAVPSEEADLGAWRADDGGFPDEKMGVVAGHRRVEEGNVKPGHVRSSSYGYVDGEKR